MNDDLPADIDRMMAPGDDADRRHQKLQVIAQALIRQIEDPPQETASGYAQFQRAALLEDEVRTRTRELEHALDLLNASNASLQQAYREKEAARQNLSAAIEAVQEGFALFDADDILVMCNSRFNAMLPDIIERLRPGLDFETYLRLVASSIHFTPPVGMSPDGWIEMRRRRHAERHFILTQELAKGRLVQVSEQRMADGGTAILQTEVTDLIRAERAERGRLLDDQAAILKATLEHLPLAVCLFDSRLRLLAWNENLTKMLTLPVTRLREGTHFDEIWLQLRSKLDFPAQKGANLLADWARSVRRRDSFAVQVMRDSGTGEARTLAIYAQEIQDGGFVLSIDDITDYSRALESVNRANETLEARVANRTEELQDALAQAERANASRARFVAAVGHDLMQPLSAATLFVGSLLEDVSLPTSRAKLEKVQRSLDSVSGLIEALLDISRLEAGQAALTVEPVALAPLFEQLREEFTPVAQAKGLELVVRPAQGWVSSDRLYLRRILQNLLANAIRYTDSGRVLLAARPRAGRVLLQVRDTGRGIPERDHRLVFAEFKRLDAKASASEGLGLGLAIVDRAAALLGHTLTLRSAPACGSTFGIEVATTAVRPPDRRMVYSGLVPGAEDRLEITALIVENDPAMMQALTGLLEQWGVNVLDVPCGEDAITLLDDTGVEPELCIVDFQLGAGMDGLVCLGQLKSRLGATSLCWMMSASRSEVLNSRAADLGVTLLSKPIAPATLAQIVAEVRDLPR